MERRKAGKIDHRVGGLVPGRKSGPGALARSRALFGAGYHPGGLLYTRDPDSQARYELFVLRRAGDLMPSKKERMRMILEEDAR